MRILVTSYGSTGDIYPMLAIGAALRRRGHDVAFLGDPRFGTDAADAGLAFESTAAVTTEQDIHYWMNRLLRTRSPLRQIDLIFRGARPLLGPMIAALRTRLPECDAAVGTFLLPFVRDIAASVGTPYASTAFAHNIVPDAERPPNGIFHAPWLPRRLRHRWHRLLWSTACGAVSRVASGAIREELRSAGLPRFRGFFTSPAPLALIAVSPALFAAGTLPPPAFHWVGYCRWQPPARTTRDEDAALAGWMGEGATPVVTFGSMAYDDPQSWMERLARNWPRDRRLVVQSGWAGFSALASAPWIRVVPPGPQDALFRRASVVIHHGGAGTTATALHAGRPQVVVPHIAEQPFWAKQVRRLGCGLSEPRRYWPERLLHAVDTALARTAIAASAMRIADLLATEDGPSRAAGLIEHHAASRRKT